MNIDAGLIFESSDINTIPLRVQGTSMQPFLFNKRDTVILRKEEKYKKGDIVVFRYHGNYVMHRIVRIDNESFTALGDNLGRPESDVPVSDILFKVKEVVRSGKVLNEKSPLWLFFSRIYINKYARKLFRKIFRLIEKPKSEGHKK